MFVELHIIQNFGPSCLNRDDTNTPKVCEFGGFRRARISSQCLKSAIRHYFADYVDELKDNLGIRTKLLPRKVIDFLVKGGKDEETATNVVKTVLLKIGFKTAKKDATRTDVLLFLNNDTPDKIGQVVLDNWEAFNAKNITKSTLDKLDTVLEDIKSDLNVDIALFGRMVASKTDLTKDAACYVAHALSTHKVNMEMDFYTAIDDLQEESESGAGMMGIIMYNSSCFYRYSVVDLNQLLENLNGNKEIAVSTLKGYLKASINAIPTGKQTSMAAFNKPDFILATFRSDQPWALTNAFAQPAKVGFQNIDLINQSVSKLEDYLKDMLELYGTPDDLKIHYCITGSRPVKNLQEIGIHQKSIKELIDTLGVEAHECYSSSS
ncbi:MAG TPA: type I-E CRISPR-associated protein Cas7/Cse4/CasC [bacterium]|nr:type I-E CRISPR-associated protein Cas7/Cse4/CasC [bacterium]